MANQVHLDILKQDVDAWNRWREEYTEMRPHLSGADLSDTDLRNADLSRNDLNEANLRGAYFSYANLSDADLSNANLMSASFNDSLQPHIFGAMLC